MNDMNDGFVHKIETGSVLFRDEKPKPRVPFNIVSKTISLFMNSNNINVKQRNIVEVNGDVYHYYAQYNSGKTNVPWYGIPQRIVEQPEEIAGFIFIYIETKNGIISDNCKIKNYYFWKATKEEIINLAQKDDFNKRYLLNFQQSEKCSTFVVKKGDYCMEMSKIESKRKQ